ncbi:putative multidrug resistance-associated protein lethal(2)03659 isoform X1 [Vespula squamosa]|uniref:Multidrug resistance-associated protein lethal(2)03659 isoform X1 n=1 Tax=Vespula squamosa TaxID=30214 RepID=A0ABD2BS94_VESSQ
MNETSLKELATIDVTEMRTIGHVSVKAYVSYLKTKLPLSRNWFYNTTALVEIANKIIIKN